MNFPGPIRSAVEVKWFKNENADWISAYTDESVNDLTHQEHCVYGDDQDCVNFRSAYLAGCLQISNDSEGGVFLLNPSVKTNDGEWEAWHFANYKPGADRYHSFKELIIYLLQRAQENIYV